MRLLKRKIGLRQLFLQIDGKGGLGGPDGLCDLGGPGGPGGPSTLLYPSLSWNDADTTQTADDRYKDNLDGLLNKVVQVVKMVQVIYMVWLDRLGRMQTMIVDSVTPLYHLLLSLS